MIDILYQDDQLMMVNKPHDLLSVPGRAPEHQDCLISRVQQNIPNARIVHRLDCATSGVMVLALNADSHRHLSRQFQERLTEKNYIAEVMGTLPEDAGSVEQPLRCDWERRPRQIVDPEQGKHALTHWHVLARGDDTTRVALTPITGRSHQLRVHMQCIGHPIVGDRFYAPPAGVEASARLKLHALWLAVHHPLSGERIKVTAPCPF